jgi:hypothetical protein
MSEEIQAIQRRKIYRTISWFLYAVVVVMVLLFFTERFLVQRYFFEFFVAGIVLYLIGHWAGWKADHAFEEAAEEIQGRISVRGFETAYKKQLVEEGYAEQETAEEIELRHIERETMARSFLTQQTQLLNDDVVARQASQLGRDRESHKTITMLEESSRISVTEHAKRAEIDTETRWKEIVQDLDAADLLHLSEQQLINKLTGYLEELYQKKHGIETGSLPDPVKRPILERYDKNIRNLEEQINDRQNRLVLSGLQKEAKGLTAGEADSGGDSQEEDSEDTESLSAPKRGRGRPRGSRNKPGGA